MHRIILAGFLLVLGVLTLPLSAADWPQWQGIDRTAVSKEKGLLQKWPEKTGPKLLWSIDTLGEGYGTPTVAAGRIYTMGNRPNDNKEPREWVFALSEKDGKELWAVDVGPVRANGGGYAGPRCSPTVDGNNVYALGMNGDLLCIDTNAATTAGGIKWRVDFRKDFKGRAGGWAYSESPLVDGDQLIVTPGGDDAAIVALNKLTGAVIWKAKVPQKDHAHYSSVIVADIHGVRQYIQFMSGGVVSVAAKDGAFLWRYDNPANGTANCSSPVYSDGHVFAASGYGTGGGLVKIIKNEDGSWTADEVYFTKRMQNHHGGMILVDGFLYGSNEGQLTCLNFQDGSVKWADRRPGKGSIAAADGRIYYREENGPITLVELTSTKYIEHGRFEQPNRSGKNTWPHPVIANGRLYLRDQETLYCYDVKAE
jgi:outer membrane protein assembly factor BamB